ncbi:hypothetical protein BGZ51_008833 [Haplosporangium sp. Z 767]|nr:hypothetical protein BGZ51_008833 [Haplosporangium sp. Z 767]KAF9194331.1 hypothetical protein BGZ50_006423 [Haplosporangium sp. Z 11]
MFKGFSAWFSPELLEYKDTWTKHGGEEKDLSEADIAFASDQTLSTTEKQVTDIIVVTHACGLLCTKSLTISFSYTIRVRPLLKILRPDWIEDSIRGQKRLSLQRYKRTFPGLNRWNSASCEGQLVVGMEAYASTKVVSLASTSIPPYQPEMEIQDLSVSDTSAQMNNVDAFQSSGQNDSSTPSTQHPAVSASVDKRQDPDRPEHHGIDMHNGEDEDNFMRSVTSSESKSLKVTDSVGARNTTPYAVSPASAPSVVEFGYTPTPDMTTVSQPTMLPRKRQLPESILRSKRPLPLTKDSQVNESYFASSDSENEGPAHWRRRQTPLREDKGNNGASVSSTKTLALSPKPSLSAGSTQQVQETEVNPSAHDEVQVGLQPADMENDSDAQSDASIDAAEYLDSIRGQVDESLPLLAVAITDISLTLKQHGK